MKERLRATLRTKTRDEWCALFEGSDACVTPVLDYVEAASHPANAERKAVVKDGKWLHPQIAPRLSSQTQADSFTIASRGGDYAAVLGEAGLAAVDIETLVSGGAVVTG